MNYVSMTMTCRCTCTCIWCSWSLDPRCERHGHFIIFRFPRTFVHKPVMSACLRVPLSLPPTVMCVFSVSSIIFHQCGHYVVKQLRERLGSCGNPYCRWSDHHPEYEHNCRQVCLASFSVGIYMPISESMGLCPDCRYGLLYFGCRQ